MQKFGLGFFPYKHAAERLWAIANAGVIKVSQGDLQGGLDASVILASQSLFGFAAELGMKAALEALNITVPRSHDLKCLFDCLPNCRRQRLIERINDLEFDQKIMQHRAIFVESRYFFQPLTDGRMLTGDYVFLKSLVDALQHEFGQEIQKSGKSG